MLCYVQLFRRETVVDHEHEFTSLTIRV